MSAVELTVNNDHPLALELSSLRSAVDRYQVKLGNLGGDITLHQLVKRSPTDLQASLPARGPRCIRQTTETFP